MLPQRTAFSAFLAIMLMATLLPHIGMAAPEQPVGKASPAPATSPRFSVKTGTCKEFMALPEGLRGLVVAWTAGRYHKLDRWVLDEATAHQVIAGVEQSCGTSPDASFRYKVVDEVKKLR